MSRSRSLSKGFNLRKIIKKKFNYVTIIEKILLSWLPLGFFRALYVCTQVLFFFGGDEGEGYWSHISIWHF